MDNKNDFDLFGTKVIKSISYDETEILNSIISLHCEAGIELDPCYSIGSFYDRSGITKPKYKFDIKPQAKGVKQASADNLPFKDGEIKSIMFDPPFIISSGPSLEDESCDGNLTHNRFSSFPSSKLLFEFYRGALIEFSRILQPNGVLIFKCQDTVSSGKNYFTHCLVMSMAMEYGFYPKDLFILMVKNRMISGKHTKQQHARKFHCYYWVFEKRKSPIDYSIY